MNANLDMTKVTHVYNAPSMLERDAHSKHSSPEILYSIAEISSDLDDADMVWAEGAYATQVTDRAWELASEDTDTLFWGDTAYNRWPHRR